MYNFISLKICSPFTHSHFTPICLPRYTYNLQFFIKLLYFHFNSIFPWKPGICKVFQQSVSNFLRLNVLLFHVCQVIPNTMKFSDFNVSNCLPHRYSHSIFLLANIAVVTKTTIVLCFSCITRRCSFCFSLHHKALTRSRPVFTLFELNLINQLWFQFKKKKENE